MLKKSYTLIKTSLNKNNTIYKTSFIMPQLFKFSSNDNLGKSFLSDHQSRVHASIKPRTISDLKKIQNYVKTTNAKSDLEENLFRQSKRNEEFNIFFKEFKEKNRGKWESIINGMEVTDDVLKEDTETEKQEEIEMLQEFERRRKFKAAFDTLHKLEDENEPAEGEQRMKKKKEKTKDEKDQRVEEILKPNPENSEIYDSKKFTLIFLDAGMVCNMTRLNRVYQRRILLYMGNKQGMIAYGIGRGPLYQDAYTDAYKELRKNLIVIEQDPEFTCPGDLKGKFNDFRLYVKSQYDPKIWGNPIMALMLRYAGLYHVNFIVKSRSKEPYAMVFAFFKAVTKNATPLQVSEVFGTKNYRHYLGRPRRYEHGLFEGENRA